nr:tetratricopeptide repeat protein [Verrucomicrobiota bacterium]
QYMRPRFLTSAVTLLAFGNIGLSPAVAVVREIALPSPAEGLALSSNEATRFQAQLRSALQADDDGAIIRITTELLKRRVDQVTAVRLYAFRARAESHQKNFKLALADAENAIRLNPSDISGYYERGGAYNAMGRYQLSLADAERAVRLKPNSWAGYWARGVNYDALEQYERAMEQYNIAVARGDKNWPVFLARAHLFEQKRMWREAAQDLDTAVKYCDKRDKGSWWRVTNADAWLKATCPQDSIRDAASAVKLAKASCESTDWKSSLSLDTLAAAYAAASQFDEAVRWQHEALRFEATDRQIPNDKKTPDLKKYQEHLNSFERHQRVRMESPVATNRDANNSKRGRFSPIYHTQQSDVRHPDRRRHRLFGRAVWLG